jgi:catechol 2,3-dioxygenase-like lactoylglutathione lyase family enzyme
MAITGTHALLYTSEPEALRAVLRDIFGLDHVDAGDGWLIFALPPAEVGVHPTGGPEVGPAGIHRVSFMCDDIDATVAELRGKGIEVKGEPEDHGYGVVATIVLPGGVEMDVYEPRHPTAI